MTDPTEISDEERALMRERKIPARFLNSEHGHEGTLELARAYASRLSRTERERDEQCHGHHARGYAEGIMKERAKWDSVKAERDALKERVGRMEAALEPFDCVARLIDMQKARGTFDRDDDEPFTSGVAWTSGGKKRTLTWGDFRRAREALAGKGESQ